MAAGSDKTDVGLPPPPARAWLALGALVGGVLAATLYVAGWCRLLRSFVGPAEAGTLLVAAVAFMGAGLGAAAAWRLLWGGAAFVPASRVRSGGSRRMTTSRRSRSGARQRQEGAHRPPLLSFGLVNLAAGTLMVALLLARRPLTAAFIDWAGAHVLPAPLELPLRFVLVVVVVWPPMVVTGFGVGLMLHGWGRPRLGRDRPARAGRRRGPAADGDEPPMGTLRRANWYHGLELPCALLAGLSLGWIGSAVLTRLRVPYTDWTLLAALCSLVVAAVVVGVSERWSLAEPPMPVPRASRRRYRWRRFRAMAFGMGLLLGALLVSGEVVRRRAVDGVEVENLSHAVVTSLAALVAGMIGRRLLLGEEPRGLAEPGHVLLATGAVGLGGLLWLGWLGARGLAGVTAGFAGSLSSAGGVGSWPSVWPWARVASALVSAAPFIGLGWVVGFGLGAQESASVDGHARTAAGMGALAFGGGLGALGAAVWIVPYAGAAAAAVVAMLLLVVIGVVVLTVSGGPTTTSRRSLLPAVRLSSAGAGLLVAAALLAAVRTSGVYRQQSARPVWRRTAMGLWGEVSVHPERSPRLNGEPLPGTDEPAAVAALRGRVPLWTCPRPEKVLVHVGGDPRLIESMAAADVWRPTPDEVFPAPRLLVLGEQVPGVCRPTPAYGGSSSSALDPSGDLAGAGLRGYGRGLFPPPATRVRLAAPGLPEHLAATRVLYDLVVADLRAAPRADLVRMIARETLDRLGDRMTINGQAWYWLDVARYTPEGLRAVVGTWLSCHHFAGVWLWEDQESGSVLVALVAAREPLAAGFGGSSSSALRRRAAALSLPAESPFNVGERLMVVDEASWSEAARGVPITLACPAPRLLRRGAQARDAAARSRHRQENLRMLRAASRPVAEVRSR